MVWDPRKTPPDLAVLIALTEEFDLLSETVDELRPVPNEEFGADDFAFEVPSDQGQPYRCITVFIGDMDTDQAAHATNRLMTWKPGMLVNIGIAGSMNFIDVKLGDVFVAKSVDRYATKGKIKDGPEEHGWGLSWGGAVQATQAEFVRLAEQLRYSSPAIYNDWRCKAGIDLDARVASVNERSLLHERKALRSLPAIVAGNLASGPFVQASPRFVTELHERDRNLKACEMEAGGVLLAAHDRKVPVPTMVLRGISDLADVGDSQLRKEQLDSVGEGALRKYAMGNALRLFLALLRTGRLPQVRPALSTDGDSEWKVGRQAPREKRLAAEIPDFSSSSARSCGETTPLEAEMPQSNAVAEQEHGSEEVKYRAPGTAIHLYRMLWQLEYWLRQMVYVELRCRDADWKAAVGRVLPESSSGSLMQGLTAGDLWDLMSKNGNSLLFENYFPADGILAAGLRGVLQIRDRIVSFRNPLSTDIDRLQLFLRDLDEGVRDFCLSYTGGRDHVSSDSVSQLLGAGPIGPVEICLPGGTWLYAEDPHHPQIVCSLTRFARPWALGMQREESNPTGVFYRLALQGGVRAGRMLDVCRMLRDTGWLHGHCMYIHVSDGVIEFTIPAIIGDDRVCWAIRELIMAALRACSIAPSPVRNLAVSEWPEYVLSEWHPMSFLDEDMPKCAMFDLVD